MKILSNNFYILKMCFKASPLYCFLYIFVNILDYAVSTVITIFLLSYMVNSMELGREFKQVLLFIFLLFMSNLISRLLGSYVYGYLHPREQVKINAYFMEKIYKQALKVDLNCYENPKFYDTYTKANEDIERYSKRNFETVTRIISIVISLVISLVTLSLYEPLIIIIACIPVFTEQVLIKKYNKEKYDRDKENTIYRRKVDYVNRTVYLQDYAKELRLSNIFTPILKSFDTSMEQMREVSKRYGKRIGMLRFFRTLLSELMVYLGVQLFIVYRYLIQGAYSLSGLTILLNAVSELTSLLGSLSWARSSLYECGMFAENFKVFMEYIPTIVEEDGAIPESNHIVLEFKEVGFSYDEGKNYVLKNINMTIHKGERIAIVGHNGSGKSTFVKLLMRLYDTSQGQIVFNGKDVKNYRLSSYRSLFGVVFQDFKVFAVSVLENILLEKAKDTEDIRRCETALRKSGIYDKISGMEEGIYTPLTKEFSSSGLIMSGGEYQKLAIARVFARICPICILDEPSSALDPISEYEVFQNILKVSKDKTVIFISHRLASTVMADRIYLFEHGEIVEQGNHKELMTLDGKYATMFKVQAKQYNKEASYED